MVNSSFSSRLAVVSLTTILLSTSVAPSFSQSSPDKVTFFCKAVHDRASDEKIPATVAWIPERQGNVRLVGWKSEYFSKKGWNAQKRCEEVTIKFQNAYNAGRLQLLTTGIEKGNPIVCGVAQQGEPCDSGSQLFTLKPHDRPDEVVQRLLDIVQGKTSDMLLQSSGNQVYVSMSLFFRKAPLIDRDAPPVTRSAGPQYIGEKNRTTTP